MAQKVNPVGFRLPVNRAWRSKWFAQKKNFGAFLVEDNTIREFVKKRLAEAGLSKIIVERYANRVRVTLFSARPGVILGRKGADVESVRMRRYWPTARGSAHPIARRLCHCKVVLTDAGKEAR